MSKWHVWVLAGLGLAAWVQAQSGPHVCRSGVQTRPLPVASARALSAGPVYYVDQAQGRDEQAGSAAAPWRTLAHAVAQLKPGDTLCLRGGIWREPLVVAGVTGRPEAPITIRAAPGELVVLDGGLAECWDDPAAAWEPVANGASHEYQSTRTYPELVAEKDGVNLMGRIGEPLPGTEWSGCSAPLMWPLHGYRFQGDFRSDNYQWNLKENTGSGDSIYCGPGLWYDTETQRVHVRLAHTQLPSAFGINYTCVTDPRQVRLVVAGDRGTVPLAVRRSAFVRVQDLVVRGAVRGPVVLETSHDLVLEGVTVYGGGRGIIAEYVRGLQLVDTVVRGVAAPWTSRAHLKYRSVEAQLVSAGSWTPRGNAQFHFLRCEFTDSVDGVFIGNVDGAVVEQCLIDNISDDGLFLTAVTDYDGTTPGGGILITQCVIRRCLTAFAFGVGHGRQRQQEHGRQTGRGIWICRNLLDFRGPIFRTPPVKADEESLSYDCRSNGDHGSPTWEPMYVYHNTILAAEPSFRSYYLNGWGGAVQTAPRELYNNLYILTNGLPGQVFPNLSPYLQVDGNWHWSPTAPADAGPEFLRRLRQTVERAAAKPVLTAQAMSRPAKPAPKPATPAADDDDDDDVPALEEEPRGPTAEDLAALAALGEHIKRWAVHDGYGDPQLAGYTSQWTTALNAWPEAAGLGDAQVPNVAAPGPSGPLDLRPGPASPLRDAGVAIPAGWTDPLRGADAGAPDIGCLPVGGVPWRVGQYGRLNASNWTPAESPLGAVVPLPPAVTTPPPAMLPALLVSGYPAPEAPVFEGLLRRLGGEVTESPQHWVPPAEYGAHRLVIWCGDLQRAEVMPPMLSGDDAAALESWLQSGGRLVVVAPAIRHFATPAGRRLLGAITGGAAAGTARPEQPWLAQPDHPWVRHLASLAERPFWLADKRAAGLPTSLGEILLTDAAGHAALWSGAVGQGRLTYVGWDFARYLPPGREPVALEQEAAWQQQADLIAALIRDLATP